MIYTTSYELINSEWKKILIIDKPFKAETYPIVNKIDLNGITTEEIFYVEPYVYKEFDDKVWFILNFKECKEQNNKLVEQVKALEEQNLTLMMAQAELYELIALRGVV